MLEIGTQTLGFECGPDGVLVHAVGLDGPDGEAVCVQGKLLLHALDGWAVGEEEDLLGSW